MSEITKYELAQEKAPRTWYNIVADLPPMAPVLNPHTGLPMQASEMLALMAPEIVQQELSTEREFEIPKPVRQLYAQWRPAPLFRARRLERALNTPAKIYYKYEGGSPTGSHKPNSALAQAFYHRESGKKSLMAETGAGQWGSAISFAAGLFGMTAKIYMVKVSAQQKPYRKALMETYGAVCVPSPSTETSAGRAVLQRDPDCPGSLGIATSEAIEAALADPTIGYTCGSALNYVLAHQTIIGQEAMLQLEMAGDYPDVVIGCAGGGSNLAGLAFPFLGNQLRGGQRVRVVAVEPSACPTLTRGRIAYDYGDSSGLTPLFRMHTLGHGFVPAAVHAGGLRAHGIAPLISRVVEDGLMDAVAVGQLRCFESGVTFARTEGILPAPESTHAITVAMEEAIRCREEGRSRTILFGLSGHGHFDLAAYQKFFAGQLKDETLGEEELQRALQTIPQSKFKSASVSRSEGTAANA